ncbi:transcription termination/antitermination protein NusA [Candidatus Campbellbacteria bacterium CG10_big_fil_rev_8_21_14_0_10_35_52]|uniref:Transcription termination/antitermination protein NusA n=1 Tax=Candidatus Campbellbacteria bacterium CG10_big_fil_rev_8_21_14_0_10_35_52 TaxID=1974527 RepID=A0A2M6WVS2_9BACT|nr:MAG: transcription termination/antitermination protein NusA [Candidatus Campbellbacteria bacterium CG10_big_fil_rev_8_21_14_0_10_35_52]
MFDLKIINSVINQLEDDRGIPREKTIDAIESSLATAYKKEYGKRGQIVRAKFDINSGKTEFYQVKIVVDESQVKIENEEKDKELKTPEKKERGLSTEAKADADERIRFNPEHHIFLEDAVKIKKDSKIDDELIFPLESKDDFGRIAAQTAKQTIMQKIREAEKVSVLNEFGQRQGEIVSGTVQRIERGNIFVDFGRANGLLQYDEQIKGERYKQGERIRAYLYSVEENPRGVFLRLSRANPKFLEKLFEIETPELNNKTVEIKVVAREAGSRSKIAVASNDEYIDPVGSLVGQRGVRVSTVMSELGGEKIDVIEWSEDPAQFIEDALSPATILSVKINESEKKAIVEVDEDQQSLAIGKGGQNVRLAAKLTGWKIDIKSTGKSSETTDDEQKNKNYIEKKDGNINILEEKITDATNKTKKEMEEIKDKNEI